MKAVAMAQFSPNYIALLPPFYVNKITEIIIACSNYEFLLWTKPDDLRNNIIFHQAKIMIFFCKRRKKILLAQSWLQSQPAEETNRFLLFLVLHTLCDISHVLENWNWKGKRKAQRVVVVLFCAGFIAGMWWRRWSVCGRTLSSYISSLYFHLYTQRRLGIYSTSDRKK